MMTNIRHLDRGRRSAGESRIYVRASLLTLAGNVVLALAKGLVAYTSGSRAIYADAINSITDVAFSLLMVLVLRLVVQPADESHPHGHNRFEPLVSLTIGAMMTLAGFEAARSAIRALLQGPTPLTGAGALAIPFITMGLKAVMYWQVKRLGDRVSSPALRASARDNLSDIWTAAAVLLGVGGSELGFELADPIAALAVSAWILRNAYAVLSESVRHLAGGAAPPELYAGVRRAIEGIDGVLGIEQLIIDYVGPQVRVDVHVMMESTARLDAVHATSHAVREIIERLPDVDHAFVHVEPFDTGGSTRSGEA